VKAPIASPKVNQSATKDDEPIVKTDETKDTQKEEEKDKVITVSGVKPFVPTLNLTVAKASDSQNCNHTEVFQSQCQTKKPE
jgi:hypothetical protein